MVGKRSWIASWVRGVPVVVLVGGAFGVGHWWGEAMGDHAPAAVAPADGAHDHAHGEGGDETADEAPQIWLCPMHPQVRQDEFGTCPICFMDLVALEAGADADPNVVPSSEALDRAGVRTEAVRRAPVERALEVWGRVAESEAAQSRVTAWVGGRVERIEVNAVGAAVRRGQRVARIWSPEVGAASEALVVALRSRDEAHEAQRRGSHEAIVEAARVRLRTLGVDDQTIASIEADRRPTEFVTVRADAGGVVTERPVRAGDWVERGGTLLQLSDLRDVWVQIEIPEEDVNRVQVGDRVWIDATGAANRWEGQVAFVDPRVDPDRRIARARVVVGNGGGTLRPDQWVRARVELARPEREPVTVPRSAVLWTGVRSLVYVYDPSVEPAVYQPVEVETGRWGAERVEIRSGVFPGELVVVNGTFVIDASLQIRGGPSMMTRTMRAGGDDATD